MAKDEERNKATDEFSPYESQEIKESFVGMYLESIRWEKKLKLRRLSDCFWKLTVIWFFPLSVIMMLLALVLWEITNNPYMQIVPLAAWYITFCMNFLIYTYLERRSHGSG